jgi:hypothetical protein
MRKGIVLLLAVVLNTASLQAKGIRFDLIPADAMSYIHVDADHFRTTKLWGRIMQGKADAEPLEEKLLGGRIGDFTVYMVGSKSDLVLMVHGDAGLLQHALASVEAAKGAVVVSYQNQDIHYASENPWGRLFGNPKAARPGRLSGSGFVSMGFGGQAGIQHWADGTLCVAFLDENLMIAASDLSDMTHAIDVIKGKKSSLAQEDRRGLKSDAPDGTFIQGVGLTAEFATDKLNAAIDRPIRVVIPGPTSGQSTGTVVTPPAGGTVIEPWQGPLTREQMDAMAEEKLRADEAALQAAADSTGRTQPGQEGGFMGFNLGGPLRGKARLARFDMGEDDQNFYMDASVAMTDGAAAEQLKNLVLGIKALITLSEERHSGLIEPVQAQVKGTEAIIHWQWPVSNLSELFRLARGVGEREQSAPGTDATPAP